MYTDSGGHLTDITVIVIIKGSTKTLNKNTKIQKSKYPISKKFQKAKRSERRAIE